jgi:hypothetical protein
MRRIVEDFESEGSIDFHTPPPGFPEQAITDAGWFKDNFSCILQNAVKYSFRQKIAIKNSMEISASQIRDKHSLRYVSFSSLILPHSFIGV